MALASGIHLGRTQVFAAVIWALLSTGRAGSAQDARPDHECARVSGQLQHRADLEAPHSAIPERPAGAVVDAKDYAGSHAGTAADPYPGRAIQAAIEAVPPSGTVYIPAGNWLLPSPKLSITRSNVTIRGAGSGNAFNRYGQPIYTASPSGPYTRLYANNDTRLFAIEGGASNVTVRDIFFDGATQGKGAGAYNAILLVIKAGPGNSFHNIRATQSPHTYESCVSTFNTPGTAWYDSLFISHHTQGLFQTNQAGPTIVQNSYFYNNCWNPIAEDDDVMEGSVTVMNFESRSLAGLGLAAGSRATGGSKNFTIRNSHFDGTTSTSFHGGQGFAVGGGINDPGYPGIINNLTMTGNWVVGGKIAAIASNEWSMYGSPDAIPGGAAGMTINGFTITHNTIIATKHARIDLRGTPSGSSARGGSNTREAFQVIHAKAHNNFLASPSNQILTDRLTIRPDVHSNLGLDVTSKVETAQPRVSTFTLGRPTGDLVPVTMSGSATYGSVMYLINESGETPSADDPGWTYVPPVSWRRSVSGIVTLYAWTKSASSVVSARACESIPSVAAARPAREQAPASAQRSLR